MRKRKSVAIIVVTVKFASQYLLQSVGVWGGPGPIIWPPSSKFVKMRRQNSPDQTCVCVYYCSTYYKVVRVTGGEGVGPVRNPVL